MSERLNKSIEILEKTAKEIEDKKISEKKKADTERTGMMQKIRDLRPRITDLIKAGQKCQELGIDFRSALKRMTSTMILDLFQRIRRSGILVSKTVDLTVHGIFTRTEWKAFPFQIMIIQKELLKTRRFRI